MDFLDSFDPTHTKTKRVRSWYLYEQFKSLESNQLDAAQKLKDRSYQKWILQQELRERRARRKIFDQFRLCTSDSGIEKSINSEGMRTTLNVSNDESFESVCELDEDEHLSHVTVNDISDIEDTFSQDGFLVDNPYLDEFKSVEDIRSGNSCTETIKSVVKNVKIEENLADDIKEELNSVKHNIAENINIQLGKVKENLNCLENYTKLCDENNTIEYLNTSESPKAKILKESVSRDDYDKKLFPMWSKLVSFAYQVIQLNRGNCYYDYSSQFLTAVLAFDVLCRGINRMCHIFQPYISPIKYAPDESDSSISHKNAKRKVLRTTKNLSNSNDYKLHSDWKLSNKKNNSEHFLKPTFEYENHSRRASKPWRSLANLSTSNKYSDHSSRTIWPELSREYLIADCHCSCHRRNPITKISYYIDSLLKEIDDYISE